MPARGWRFPEANGCAVQVARDLTPSSFDTLDHRRATTGAHMSSPLTEKQERILILFKVAIERERDAQKLYSEMLMNCEDPELKEIIESLRVAEQTHEEILLDRYAAMRRSGKYAG
jgi:hypothetical protein